MRLTLTWSFLLAVLGWVALAIASLTLLDAARSVVSLLVVAATLAALLTAPVERLERHVPRVLAVVLVVLGVSVVIGGATATQVWQLEQHAQDLADDIGPRVASLEQGSTVREVLEQAQVPERARRFLDRLPQVVVLGTDDQSESLRRSLDVLLVLILTVYGTLNGPQVVRNLTGTIARPARRVLVHRSLRAGMDRAAAYVRRSLAWGVVSGAVVAALAVALDVPGPSTLAVWAGVWSIVPVLGVAVGYAPIVALLALDDVASAALVTVAGVIWWALGLVVIRRYVAAPIRLGPLLVTVALAIGLQFGWLVGSLVSLFALAWGAGFLAEVGRRTDPGETPLSELTEDPVQDGTSQGETAVVVAPAELASAPAGDRDGGDEPVRLIWSSLDARSGARAAVLVVLAVVLVTVARSAQPGPTWVVVGVVIGLALDPAARWVGRHTGLGNGAAVGVVIGGTVLALAGLVGIALPSLVENLRTFDEQVLQVADDVEQLPIVGDELRRRGTGDELRRMIDRIPDELAADPTPLTRVLETGMDVLSGSFWTFLLAIATLIDGRRIAQRARQLLPPGRRERGDQLMGLVYDTLVRYAAGSALVSGLVGLAVFAVAIGLGIPLAPVLGVWALLWTFVPQIGGFMAAVPLVFLALVEGTVDGIIALALYGVAWQVKNRILMPVIIGRAVSLSPLVAMTAVLIGGASAGLVGAVLATPLVGTVRLLHQHLRPSELRQTPPQDHHRPRRHLQLSRRPA